MSLGSKAERPAFDSAEAQRHLRLLFWSSGLVVFLGCCVILASKSFLFDEASELLVIVLERGAAYRVSQALVETRPTMWLLMMPVIVLSWFTDSLRALVLAFGAAHVSVPLVSLAGVWYGLRNSRVHEIFVASSAICLLGLPGQIYVVSGQLMVSQLYWLVLVCLVNAESHRLYRWILPLLALALFFLHPVVAVMFAGTGAFLIVRAFVSAHRRRTLLLAGIAFLCAGLLRGALMFVTSDVIRLEDTTHPSLMKLQASFTHPRIEYVVLYFALTLAASLALLSTRFRNGRVSVACLLGAGVSLLAFFAGNPMALEHGVHCIGWIVALVIPLHMAFLHLALDPSAGEPRATPVGGGMMFASLLPACLFLFVVSAASWQFASQLAHARNLVADRPSICVEREGLFDGWSTSFDDPFGYFEYEYLATGPSRRTRKVVLEHGLCSDLCRPSAGSEASFFELELPPGTDGATTPVRCPLKDLLE